MLKPKHAGSIFNATMHRVARSVPSAQRACVPRLIFIGISLQVLQQLVGMNAFMYFGPRIFEMMGASPIRYQAAWAVRAPTIALRVCQPSFPARPSAMRGANMDSVAKDRPLCCML